MPITTSHGPTNPSGPSRSRKPSSISDHVSARSASDRPANIWGALTIHGVEARHAAFLNVLTGADPFPDAVNAPMTPDEVLKIAGLFIKKG